MPEFPPPPPSEGDFPPPPPGDLPPPPPRDHVPPPPPSGVNTSWTPGPPASGTATHVPKNISNVPVVRQSMSRNAKLGWVTAILLGALGCGGYWGYQYLNCYPKQKEIKDFVEKQLAIPGRKVVDVSSKPVGSGSSSGGFNLIGEWHGQMSDETPIGYIFQNNNNVTIQIDNVNFPGSYALRQSSPYWELDIKGLKNGSYNGTTVTVPSYLHEGTLLTILQPISADSFKIEDYDAGDARPTAFDKDAIVMTRTGTAPAASAQNNTPAPPPVGVRLAFTATLELTEALFATIPAEQFMRQQGADPMVFHKIQSILNSPNAERLRAISHVSGPVTDFTGKTIVRETFPQGHRYTSSGVIQAVRQDGKWRLTLVSGPNPDKDAPAFDYRLSAFKGEVLSTNQPDQLKEINDLISRANDTLQKLQQAQEQNRQETLASQKAARLAAQQEAQQRRAAAEAARQRPAAGSSVNAAPAQPPAAAVAATTTVNNVLVSSGTSITVSTLDTIDTSASLQLFYRATTAGDINLSDGTTLPAGSDAKLIVFANGANYQIRLDSLTANGINIPLNTDVFNIGTVGQGASRVKIGFGGISLNPGALFKSSRIKPGKLFTFHQQ